MTPLVKRLPRELKHNIGKYLGIFLLMAVTIAITSGFLLSSHSITVIIDEMPAQYRIEDGHFTTSFKATDAQLKAAEGAAKNDGGVEIYESYSVTGSFKAGDDATERKVRAYVHREHINLAAYAQGEAPTAKDQIAIDRVFAARNNISIGDNVELYGVKYTVCGIMTLSDNMALFENNTDFTVNTLGFGVAELSQDGFDALLADGRTPTYSYAFKFKDENLTLAQRTDIEADMMEALTDADARVTELLDSDANQGISYAGEDIESDSAMWVVLLYIIVAIMAFVFVVLTSSTIEEESAVIGTLLASGYRRRELVGHYMAAPCIVGIVAAIVGNVVGFTFMTAPMQELYYGSYSFPPYHTTWSWTVFVQTTVVPVAVLVLITLLGLLRKMGHTPLAFLRHETSKGGVKRGFALPERLGFITRFRLRVFLRNLGNFATLFVGIGFASLLLLFSLAIQPTMTHYAESLHETVAANHQYTLKAALELEGTDEQREAWKAVGELQDVDAALLGKAEDAADDMQAAADKLKAAAETLAASPTSEAARAAAEAQDALTKAQDEMYAQVDSIADQLGKSRDDVIDMVEKVEDIDTDSETLHPVNTIDNGSSKIAQAEKYAVYSLEYDRGGENGVETITVYGISENSRYWDGAAVGNGKVAFGNGFVEKFGLGDAAQVSMYDKYENKTYSFTETSSWGSASNMNVYMSLADFNKTFGNDADYFNGYASDEALQLDARYLASDLTPDDMDAIGQQFTDMMDDLIGMLVALSVFIFLVFIYLLTKSVIDHSARAISYMKVFGYRDGEVSKLYVRSITWCVIISLIVLQPLIIWSITALFKMMLLSYSGNIEIFVPFATVLEVIVVGFATYLVVALLHMRTIKRVPMSLALKTSE